MPAFFGTPKTPSLLRLSAAIAAAVSTSSIWAETSTKSCHFDTSQDTWVCALPNAPTDDTSADPERAARLANIAAQLQLDWQHKSLLTPAARAQLHPGCDGAYIDPLQNAETDELIMAQYPLIIEADSTEVLEGNFASLSGDVRVSQGPRSIAADAMSYDRLKDQARLDGHVTIRQKGMLIRGDSARISTIDDSSEFNQASFVMHDMHMRGKAGAVQQAGPGKIVLREGAITSCEPGSNAWSLEGKELTVDKNTGQGYGKNVKLRLGNVPVFYMPYFTFPVGDQRRSGFLFPSVSSSKNGGIDISAPYYINLAPNYDLTLTPRLISDRGAMLESEFRHLSRHFATDVSAAFLPNDDGGKLTNQDGSETNNPNRGSNRWLFQLEQTGGLREGWYSNIDYTQTSDENYFRDLGTSSFSIANETYLNQSVEVGKSLNNWQISLRAQDYQTLLLDLDAPYRKMPQFVANGLYNAAGMDIELNHQVTRFDHVDKKRSELPTIITGERIFLDYRLHHGFENQSGFIKPELGYKVLHYQLHSVDSNPLNTGQANLAAGQASLDLGLVLENTGGSYLQTLEPRAFYLFREYEDHSELYNATENGQSVNFDTSARTFSYGQLYRDSRFSGSDRLDDANQITLGLTNRWYSHRDGHEHFNISVGQIKHFKDRRIGLESEINSSENASEWALEFAANWRNGSGLYGGMIYDHAADQTNRFAAGYNFASEDQLTLYSLGYTFLRKNPEVPSSEQLDQIDGAFIAPVNPQWFLMGRVNYDLENKQELETFFGFEYNDCCYRFRLLGRRWLDNNTANTSDDTEAIFDSGIFFEVHLKGLGGSGAKVNSILEDAIPGYKRRESALNKQ